MSKCYAKYIVNMLIKRVSDQNNILKQKLLLTKKCLLTFIQDLFLLHFEDWFIRVPVGTIHNALWFPNMLITSRR